MIEVKIKRIKEEAIIPKYAKEGDAGCDLYAIEDVVLKVGERKLISTGIALEIPNGYYGRVAPRSGFAFKNGIDTLAGVVDSGYRNEVGVLLINLGQEEFKIEKGMRIAQLIFTKIEQATFTEVESLSESDRGTGGYGHSGIK